MEHLYTKPLPSFFIVKKNCSIIFRVTQLRHEHCAIQIRNLSLADTGPWRLTSSNGPTLIRGMTWIRVRSEPMSYFFQLKVASRYNMLI